jgi:hypothetical protein
LITAWREREWWVNFLFLGDGKIEDEEERDERAYGESSGKTGIEENFGSKSIDHPRYSMSESWSGV